MTKIRPLSDKVIVERVSPEGTTKGGIIIPDTAKEKPQRGMVKAVGPGKLVDGKRQGMQVKKGDAVLFTTYGGTEIQVDGNELMIMDESDILGIVE